MQPTRCPWPGNDELYCHYHDKEWGRPVSDEFKLFEKICLEGFQTGLSWLTILRKRDNFRAAFEGFDFNKLARYGERDVERLLADPGIVRHRGKINATLNNAARAIEMKNEFGSLKAYFWRFEPDPDTRPTDMSWESLKKITQTEASQRLSKDLKKRGWSFVGPTTAYAFMQAMGLVNDHVENCFLRAEVEQARQDFVRP